MNDSAEGFSEKQRKALSTWAVNELIADAEAKRLLNDKSLVEPISTCIRSAEVRVLRDVKFLHEQRELEGRNNFTPRRDN